MILTAAHINPPIKAILRTMLRIDDAAVAAIPMRGPLILATNHINWLDAPVGFSHLHPRQVTAFAKIETWDKFLMRTLFNAWDAIPISRGQVDFSRFPIDFPHLIHLFPNAAYVTILYHIPSKCGRWEMRPLRILSATLSYATAIP